MNARDYLMLPWSIRGPVRVTDDQGNVHFEMRVAELPDFLVATSSEREALYEFKPALLAFLESYTNDGEVPPSPKEEPVEYSVPLVGRPLGQSRVPSDDATAGPPVARVALA